MEHPWWINEMGGAREGTYHLWLILVDVRQKITKFCEAMIFQFRTSGKNVFGFLHFEICILESRCGSNELTITLVLILFKDQVFILFRNRGRKWFCYPRTVKV